MTTEEFIEKAKKVHGDKYDYSKVEYKTANDKVCIICPEHGEFWQRASNHLRGVSCPKCSHRSTKYTNEEFIAKAREIHGDKYDYSKINYVNNHTKVCIICPKHGEFWQSPNAHLNGEGCSKCHYDKISKLYRDNTEIFINKAIKKHGDKYDYSKVNYVNNHTKVCIICPEHGEFWQSPNKHIQGQKCVKCSRYEVQEKNRLTTEEFIEKSQKIHNYKYNYTLVKYFDYDTPVQLICPEHGEFWQTPDSHLQGSGCPSCAHKQSKQENELVDFISEIIGKDNIKTKVRRFLKVPQQELDILIPHLNIAIEYNGLRWHSENFGKDKYYHLKKTLECEDKKIRLIHIFEDEWVENKEIVKSKIKHILHCDNSPKIYARKCSIREIKYNEARIFLNKNHIQGACNSSVYLGCLYNNELIGVMSFRREIKNTNKWELTRFASDIKYNCIGVGGKLFKYFIINYKPSEIKSFADRRWTVNKDNLYIKLGFKLDKILKPDYKYVIGNKRIHKFNFRKQILLKKYNNKGLTKDMTDKLGFYRIWDCGLYKYKWKKK